MRKVPRGTLTKLEKIGWGTRYHQIPPFSKISLKFLRNTENRIELPN